jgi:hypothetical protein
VKNVFRNICWQKNLFLLLKFVQKSLKTLQKFFPLSRKRLDFKFHLIYIFLWQLFSTPVIAPLAWQHHKSWRASVCIRVARFLLVQHTKMGNIIPNHHNIYQMASKYTKWPLCIYTNIFHSKTIHNLPKLGFFCFENMPSGSPGLHSKQFLQSQNI